MKKFADISLLFVTFVWGTTFVLVQNAISSLEPFSFNGIRFFIAALLLILWLVLFEKRQLTNINKKLIFSGVFIGFWLFLGYATQTIGLLYTTSSKAGFITGLSVVFVPLLSMLLLKQTLSKNAIFGVIVATIGLFLLTATDISSLNIGDAFVFVCAIAFAMQIIFTGKYCDKYPTLLLTVIQISTVCLLSIISSFLFEDWSKMFQPKVILSKEVFIAILITAVFATAIAFLLQTNFQKYTTTTRVALIFAMEPVFAAITGYFWAHDRLSTSALFGCLLIFAGMIFAELPVKKMILFRKKEMKNNSF
ncbi:MAG TPA: DMT family transporter [Bacillales bacterium]|nr:DMT family transporter [Bacillales bacterium]